MALLSTRLLTCVWWDRTTGAPGMYLLSVGTNQNLTQLSDRARPISWRLLGHWSHFSMLRARLKSTLAAVATEAAPCLRDIPVAPETGFGPLRSSYAYFAESDGFRLLFERFHKLHTSLGPIYRLRFMPFQPYTVSISDPDAAAEIYRHEGAMPQRQTFDFWKLYRDERNLPVGLANTNEYAVWKKYRLSLGAHLLQPHNVGTWVPRVDAVANDLAARVCAQASASSTGEVPVTLLTKAFALEAVSSLVFGKRMGCLSPDHLTPIAPTAQALISAVDGFFATSQQLMAVPPKAPLFVYKLLPAYKEHVMHSDYIFRLGHEMVQEKLASTEVTAPDLLTMFLQRPELDETDAITQAIEILFGGVDTTSIALLWSLYCIATSPHSREIQLKMRAEVESILDGATEFDAAAHEKLSYIRAVVKETLRLYPAANPNQRILSQDMTVLGYDIPKGTSVMMATYTMSRDPAVFDEPEIFKPERWIDRDHATPAARKKKAYSTLPFGMGSRSCIGRRLAETEIYLALAHLVRRMEMQWIPEETHPKPILQLLLVPNKPLTLRFQPWTT
ncbi:hypothetical protein SDRG_05513 [Saprolegnia diclina VS20]|uniref:Cytochrome P450 oxidoreductase n=1 Tax=Saprolegnia diclina (strain VS20) TaxID=1156394 RepID=T0QH43_SAPDV|nr:hypothetical protein SDRG_05513 [Saprolegnia diclina VS20]EQC37289.1 hypothetical protein SDRG_05513 [Saprolegnia diclina VS20]|eukprot:XP_008609451.1 hypothetical protein SDRG_05513 [Saprolegnia diclina VS20]